MHESRCFLVHRDKSSFYYKSESTLKVTVQESPETKRKSTTMATREDESDGHIEKSVHAIADRLKEIVLEMNMINEITGREVHRPSDRPFPAASAEDEWLFHVPAGAVMPRRKPRQRRRETNKSAAKSRSFVVRRRRLFHYYRGCAYRGCCFSFWLMWGISGRYF